MKPMRITHAEMASIRAPYHEVFHKPLRRRLLAPLAALAVALYLVFSWFFLDVPGVIANAQWERAQTYIADWYSWEATPRFRFKEGGVALEWTRSLLGETPDPEWIERTGEQNYVVAMDGPANRIEISPSTIVAVVGGVAIRSPSRRTAQCCRPAHRPRSH